MGAPFARVAGGPNGAGTVALSVALVVGTKVSKKGSPDVRVLVLWNGICAPMHLLSPSTKGTRKSLCSSVFRHPARDWSRNRLSVCKGHLCRTPLQEDARYVVTSNYLVVALLA